MSTGKVQPRNQAFVGTVQPRGKVKQVWNKLSGKTSVETERVHSSRSNAQSFSNAITAGNLVKASAILTGIKADGDSESSTQFFTGHTNSTIDKTTVQSTRIALESGDSKLQDLTKVFVVDFLRENDGIFNSITPTHLDQDKSKQLVLGLLELSTLEGSAKEKKLNEIEKLAGVSLRDEETLKKFAKRSQATSHTETNYASVILRLKSIKNPVLNMIYNLSIKETGDIQSEADYTKLFAPKDASSVFKGESGKEITDGLLEQYFRGNGLSNRKNQALENTKLDWAPLLGREFRTVKIDASADTEMAQRLGIDENFNFNFPSFLKDIAHGELLEENKGFDAFWKAYTSLEIDRERIQSGTHPHLSSRIHNQADKNKAEKVIATQQAYMLEILHSPSILGQEAHDAIHAELEHNRELRLFNLGYIENLKDISENANHLMLFHALDESFKDNTSWSHQFKFEVADPDNGPAAVRPCADYTDACEWLNSHSDDIRSEAKTMSNTVLSAIHGTRDILDSADSTFGFSDQTLWIEFNKDCYTELDHLGNQFRKDWKDYNKQIERTEGYVSDLTDSLLSLTETQANKTSINTRHFSEADGHSLITNTDANDFLDVYNAVYKTEARNSQTGFIIDPNQWETGTGKIKNHLDHIIKLNAIKAKLIASTSPNTYTVETINTLDQITDHLRTGLSFDPNSLNNPLTDLTSDFEQTVQSVISRPAYRDIQGRQALYFDNLSVNLTDLEHQASRDLFGSCMQKFQNDMKKHFDEVGGELETYLKSGNQTQAMNDLMLEGMGSSRINEGEKILLNVMLADNREYARFTENPNNQRLPENTGLLIQGINAKLDTTDVVGHEERTHEIGADTQVSLVHYLEWVKRGLTLAGSNDAAKKDILDFFYNKALGGVIPPSERPSANVLLAELNNNFETYVTDPSAMKSKMGAIYAKASAAVVAATSDKANKGIYKLLQMTDARAHVSRQMSDRYAQIESQVEANTEYNLVNIYGEELHGELMKNGTLVEDIKDMAQVKSSVTVAMNQANGAQEVKKILRANFGSNIADTFLPESGTQAKILPVISFLDSDRADGSLDSFVRMIKRIIQSFLGDIQNDSQGNK